MAHYWRRDNPCALVRDDALWSITWAPQKEHNRAGRPYTLILWRGKEMVQICRDVTDPYDQLATLKSLSERES